MTKISSFSEINKKDKKQITAKCSPEDIEGMQNEYAQNKYINPHHLNLNIYNVAACIILKVCLSFKNTHYPKSLFEFQD